MGKARYLADLLSSGGDVKSDRFDDMPAIDWNSASGKTRVLNKPALLSIGITSTTAMAGNTALFSGNYDDLASKPSLLSVGTTSSTAMAGDTPILQVETVTTLPASPVAGILYLVEA